MSGGGMKWKWGLGETLALSSSSFAFSFSISASCAFICSSSSSCVAKGEGDEHNSRWEGSGQLSRDDINSIKCRGPQCGEACGKVYLLDTGHRLHAFFHLLGAQHRVLVTHRAHTACEIDIYYACAAVEALTTPQRARSPFDCSRGSCSSLVKPILSWAP